MFGRRGRSNTFLVNYRWVTWVCCGDILTFSRAIKAQSWLKYDLQCLINSFFTTKSDRVTSNGEYDSLINPLTQHFIFNFLQCEAIDCISIFLLCWFCMTFYVDIHKQIRTYHYNILHMWHIINDNYTMLSHLILINENCKYWYKSK